MTHLQVLVDGETRYDGPVHTWQLPNDPTQFPAALGANPNTPVTPLARLFVLTAFIELMRKTLTEHPLLKPLDVDIHTRGPGCVTITIDTPNPLQP